VSSGSRASGPNDGAPYVHTLDALTHEMAAKDLSDDLKIGQFGHGSPLRSGVGLR
jgi:hypothetical protein